MSPSKIIKAILFGTMFLIAACNANHNKEAMSHHEASSMADSVAYEESTSSSAAQVTEKTKDFIRTADLKFKVKDVIKATYEIEDIVAKHDGFVTYTNLTSTIDHHELTQVSADSSLESNQYSTINSITLRVPNYQLDTTLKSIGTLVDYMDYRIIKSEDVGLQMLSNRMMEDRIKNHEKRLNNAIDKRGKEQFETIEPEEHLLYKQEQADNAVINNLRFIDQIQYSTVNINIYQKPVVSRVLIANEKNIDAYEPGFAAKMAESLYSGWKIMSSIILFIAQFWGLILFGVIIFLVVRKYGYQLKK